MKTQLKEFISLNEDYSKKETIESIKANVQKCLDSGVFLFRGLKNQDKIGHRNVRAARNSQIGSNVLMNYFSVFHTEIPNRSKSYFMTNSQKNAETFGDAYIVFPHDNVDNFGVVYDDFNLIYTEKLRKIGFSNTSGLSGVLALVCRNLYDNLLRLNNSENLGIIDDLRKFSESSAKIINEDAGVAETVTATKEDFENFRVSFKTLFPILVKNLGKFDIDLYGLNFIDRMVIHYPDFDIIEMLNDVATPEQLEIECLNFDSVVQKLKDANKYKDKYEIWFEGKISYFNVKMIRHAYFKQHTRSYSTVDADIFGWFFNKLLKN